MSMDNPAAGQKFAPSATWFRNVSAAVARNRMATGPTPAAVGDTGPSIVYARNDTGGTRMPGDAVAITRRYTTLGTANFESFLHDDLYSAVQRNGTDGNNFGVVRNQAAASGVLAVQVSGIAPVRLLFPAGTSGEYPAIGAYLWDKTGIISPTENIFRPMPIYGRGKKILSTITDDDDIWGIVDLSTDVHGEGYWPVNFTVGSSEISIAISTLANETIQTKTLTLAEAGLNLATIYLQWTEASYTDNFSLVRSVTGGYVSVAVGQVSTDDDAKLTRFQAVRRPPPVLRAGIDYAAVIAGVTYVFRDGLLREVY